MALPANLSPLIEVFKVKEVRNRILFTIGILAAYRLGSAIPIPEINADALQRLFEANRNTLLGFLDIFSGGALGRFAIFSLGIMPYINASIIMSLVQGAHMIPYIDKLAKEGEVGRKKINQITRYLTVLLATIQAFGLTVAITKMPIPGGIPVVENPTIGFFITTVITLLTGTILVMWLGEMVNEFGIGNGISLIIFTGIVDRLPAAVKDLFRLLQMEEILLLTVIILIAIVIIVTGLVVWLETAQRKIPIQYAQRVVGRKIMGGQSTFLPIKVDQSGVIAVIFAVSLLSLPMTVTQFVPNAVWAQKITALWNRGGIIYEIFYAGLIIFFCYFYNTIQLNPKDLAENLKRWGGFIPGIRPGESTEKYIKDVLAKITLGGALAVAAIAILPDYMRKWFNAPFFFGGTSLLIVVGVALDTIGQIESKLIMRHYDGFLKKGRIKGRWFNVGA